MAQYLCKCRVTLEFATMFVEANSLEEARTKATKHEWDEIDYKGAALVDWEPDLEHMKENK